MKSMNMKYNNILKVCKYIASKIRYVYHAPAEQDVCAAPSHEAYVISYLIRAIDDKEGSGLDLKFGGCGDNGEYLAGIIDVLIESDLIVFNGNIFKEFIDEQ